MRMPVASLCMMVVTVVIRASASAQDAPAYATVRSTDDKHQVTMRVEISGKLFAKLSVPTRADGSLKLAGNGGTATTPTDVDASALPGTMTFSAPSPGPEIEVAVVGTHLRAKGHVVRLVRDSVSRKLRVEASPKAATK
jgi:hypothetical protein